MRIDKKRALTLFALTLLTTSLLLVNMNGPTSAQQTVTPIHLHGPSLTPIHLNSNKTLTPIHMHLVTPPDILQWDSPELGGPNCTTDWVKIYPDYDPDYVYHLSSWEDNGDQKLGPNDQIDMTDPDGNVTWYHVDRMTVTLLLSNLTEPPDPAEWPGKAEPTLAIELKWPTYWPEIKYDYNLPPQGPPTSWHEVWPHYSNTYNLTSFSQSPFDPTPWRINPCDVVDLTDSNGIMTWWHVESVSTDLILREKIMNPICTWWHAIYPEEEYCKWYHITSWESYPDPYCDRLSPNDQIDMTDLDGNVTWYNVDRVTVTLNVTDRTPESDPTKWMKIELKTHYYEEMFEAFKHPNGTLWHEVVPNYCNLYNLTRWNFWTDDNCNGVLDVCDYIWLLNMTAGDLPGSEERWHVEDITYDLILNQKIDDPTNTIWEELYPNFFGNSYIGINWTDNSDKILSPSDYIGLLNQSDGTDANYHVDNVTLTMHVISLTWDFYIELNATFDEIYAAKTKPLGTWWYNVYPYYIEWYNLSDWTDNCNGVLDYCDYVTLSDPEIQWSDTFHIEELALDIVVSPEAPPPPPPPPSPMYWKPDYTDYAPSGVPDFDQRQDNWNISSPFGGPWWTWCAPTAVANSLLWMDSKFHPSNLLTAYPSASGEHDPSNVQPFIQHLAWLMDTDANRTGMPHRGTWTWDMETGIAQYLSWSGVNPLGDVNGDGIVDMTDYHLVNAVFNGSMAFDIYADIWPETVTGPYTADNVVNQSDLDLVTAHMGETGKFYEHTLSVPDFSLVAEEVYRCEDVVLVLGFWTYDPVIQQWSRVGYPDTPYDEIGLGHAVTVAGINSTSLPPVIAISDPANDAFEAGLTPGRSPVNHTHMPPEPPYTMHNNASLVSHDIYNVTFIVGCPGGTWALQGYVGNPQAGAPLGAIAVVEAVVITSPKELPPVGGVWIPVDKLALLAPYIALASTIMSAVVVTVVLFKRKKKP